ncbi:MAG: 7-carboxy-7-deazaguanine synthase QueE [Cellvibrionaceae bacterium]|nr:7-carboxy-7-deazaguanine synthase QueE [Cellvibrionaceae bacterium]
MTSLRVTEIFLSIQGESDSVGLPTVFVRLTGCPLRCGYCDSEYAFFGGQKQSIEAILARVKGYGVQAVCVTGGEPLAQPDCCQLLTALCDSGLQVSIETSGAISVQDVDQRVRIVMDLKTPGSGEVSRNDYNNLHYLKNKDQIKFVICDKQDYQWACFTLRERKLLAIVGHIFFSPAYKQVQAAALAEWILADKLPVRLQLQLHKTLWGDKPGV